MSTFQGRFNTIWLVGWLVVMSLMLFFTVSTCPLCWCPSQ